MNRSLGLAVLAIIAAVMLSCTQKVHEYPGRFTDEFDNTFELRDDHTATIHFAGSDNIVETKWRDSVYHSIPFAAIEYNGDKAYYYLHDGFLYRRLDDMRNGTCAIIINYDD